MESLNSIEITGVVGRVNTQTVSDRKVANFSVVTEESFRDANGCAVIETTWFNVIAWQSDTMPDFDTLERGSRVNVKGRLRFRRYINADGEPRSMNEVVARSVRVVQ